MKKSMQETALTRTYEKMAELKDNREREEEKVTSEIKALRKSLATAEANLKEATRATDLDAYQEAKAEIGRCKTALQMYEARFAQLNGLSMITEQESDAVIDDLLTYEQNLREDFEKSIEKHIAALAELVGEYDKEVTDIEKAITTWTGTIHSNYRTFGRGSYLDKTTGERVYKSNYAVPVHATPYEGGDAFCLLKDYLKKAGIILY